MSGPRLHPLTRPAKTPQRSEALRYLPLMATASQEGSPAPRIILSVTPPSKEHCKQKLKRLCFRMGGALP